MPRAYAIYEKQLFTEKMVAECFMDRVKIEGWNANIKASMLQKEELVEIWEDRTEVAVSMSIDSSSWINAERRQDIISGAQGDSIAAHASAIWQDFDVPMVMPEPHYDQRQYQYWFKLKLTPPTTTSTLPGKPVRVAWE